MTVRVYTSNDTSAPVLANVAGSLISLFDACLVTGYGSKTPAGWTKEYSGTNKAVYKQGTGSNGFYLRVDDSGTTTARVVGYEAMTDVDTGTNPFPTAAQLSGGVYWFKCETATSRPWLLVATERAFYFYSVYSASYSSSPLVFFGDIQTYKVADAYHTVLIGGVNTTVGTAANYMGDVASGTSINTVSGHYIARGADQTTLSPGVSKAVFPPFVNGANPGATRLNESPANGKMFLTPLMVVDNFTSNISMRGYLPGLYCFGGGYSPYGSRQGEFVEVNGTDTVAGRTFVLVSSGTDMFVIETTDNW